MKKLLYSLIISVVVACGGGGDDDTPTVQPEVNKAPTIPTLSSPSNNLICIDNSVLFNWTTATDPNNDAISYKIQVSKDLGF